MHGNSYDAIEKQIIKRAVNRSIRDFKGHAVNDKTQEIFKGVESALEHKSKDKERAQNLDKVLAGKSLK